MSSGSSSARPPDWITEHMDRYVATNGADGHIFNGVPTLLLSTTGKKSGQKIMTPLIYGRDGDRYLVVASMGGAPTHPKWYTNLVADPQVGIQVLAEKFEATARPAGDPEKPALWATMAKIWPAYNDYQKRTTRQIPVVVIERKA
jgi:deazaflavin-dependent oxidoreductase (nitroreductase family)